MNIVDNILREVRVDFMDAFNANFQRKAFFDNPWPKTKIQQKRGSLMMRTGALRRGSKSRVVGDQVHFFSDVPYAALHNNGGKIKVTAAMKKYFWARFYMANGAQGKASNAHEKKRNQVLSQEAQYWKNMALMPVGKEINIPKRQFMGFHPSLNPRIEAISDKHFNNLSDYIESKLKR